MKRFLCIAALFAIVMIPDWASACWARRGGPIFYRRQAYYAPRYYTPAYYYPPQATYGPPVYSLPGYGYTYSQPYTSPPQPITPLAPPRVEQSQVAPKTSSPIAKPEPAPPSADPVVPAKRAEPEPAANEPRHGLSLIPKYTNPTPNTPSTPPAPAPAPKPKEEQPKFEEPTIPPLNSPRLPDLKPNTNANPGPPAITIPAPDATLPPLQLPMDGKDNKDNKPATPPKEQSEPSGTAVPVPAPSEDTLIPPPNVPPKNNPSLPPLTVPPDAPVLPDAQDKARGMTESKSSPLTAAPRELKVTVFPAAGSNTNNGGLFKIGFFNHTNRDVVLTIEGKAVTLPAQSYLHAQLPPTFTWKYADKPAAKEVVPADASGLDVLIRE